MHIELRTLGLFAATAALALTGCDENSDAVSSGGEAETQAAEASDQGGGTGDNTGDNEVIAMAGTGWLTIGNDGAVQTTFLDSDGRYRDFRNGELLAEGGWERAPDDRLCFEPDAGRGACWVTKAPDADGSILVTDADGKSVEIKRVAYIAPTDVEDSSN